MRTERSLIRRRGAAVADQMVSSSNAKEEPAQFVPSSSYRMSSCPRRKHPNELGYSTHSNTSRSSRASLHRFLIRSAPVFMLTYLVFFLSIGLAASEKHDEEFDQPQRVITQQLQRTNAFGSPNHQLAPRVPEIVDGQTTDETYAPEYVSTSNNMLRTSQADDHDEDDEDQLTPNEIQRQRRRRKRQRQRCSRLNLQKKCSLCRRQVRAQARKAVCHTVKSLEMYKKAGIKVKGASVDSSAVDLKDSWSCYNTFDQCARRRLMIRMCGNAGRKAYDSCNVGKIPLPDDLLEPSGTPQRVDTCTDLPAEEFDESFVAEVEVECNDNGSPDAPIEVSAELNAVFKGYFQRQEDCGVFDDGEFDGCGIPRQVLSADVVSIDEGSCFTSEDANIEPIVYYDEVGGDAGNPNNGVRQRLLQQFQPAKNRTNKRKRRVKLKGRSKKSGKCRRACASRSKKVDDSISRPNNNQGRQRRSRNLLRRQFHRDVIDQHGPPRSLDESTYGVCSPDATDRGLRSPDLVGALQAAQDDIGFVAVRGTSIVETIDCATSDYCNDGSNFCCGTSGCSCSSSDATAENCLLGTPSGSRANDGVCELFADGIGIPGDQSSNLCCGADPAIDECSDTCVTEAPTSSPSSPPTERCDLEFSTDLSPGNQANSVSIRVAVTNLCVEPATLTRISMATCAKCIIGDATGEDCGGSFSILSDVTNANSIVNPNGASLDPDVTVEFTLELQKLQLAWDQEEGESITCAAYTIFDYGALTSQNGVSKTLVDVQQIYGENPGLAIDAVDQGV